MIGKWGRRGNRGGFDRPMRRQRKSESPNRIVEQSFVFSPLAGCRTCDGGRYRKAPRDARCSKLHCWLPRTMNSSPVRFMKRCNPNCRRVPACGGSFSACEAATGRQESAGIRRPVRLESLRPFAGGEKCICLIVSGLCRSTVSGRPAVQAAWDFCVFQHEIPRAEGAKVGGGPEGIP